MTVGPITVTGSLAERTADLDASDVRSAVLEGLGRGQVAIERLEGNCQDRACWIAIARKRGANPLLFTTVEHRGPDQHITLELVDPDRNEVLTALEGFCEICGSNELLVTTADLSATLSVRLSRRDVAPALVVLRGSPAGATVEIDGEVVGTLPWEGELTVGEHTLRISQEGYVPLHRVLVANAGFREHLELALQPDVPRTRSRPPSHDPPTTVRLAVGGALTGSGALTLAGGIALFAYDGRPHRATCRSMGIDANGRCALQHETTNAAVATTVVGGAAVVAGAALIVHTLVTNRRDSIKDQARIRPSLGGVTVRF